MTLTHIDAIAPLLVGGQERSTTESFPVYDPHDGSIVGRASSATTTDALEAVAAAQAAWPAWAALGARERVRLVLASLDTLASDADERAELLVRESGKVRIEAQIDLHVFDHRFRQAAVYAAELDSPERIPGPPFTTTIEHVPAGVVTIIIPFNWPLAILAASLPYALMAGNAVIVKPPPTAPLATVRTLAHIVDALPPGVLGVLTGADDTLGPTLVSDPRIKHVGFTGSVRGGRRIMELAAANLTNVTLELGGNDPGIVLADARLDEAAFDRA